MIKALLSVSVLPVQHPPRVIETQYLLSEEVKRAAGGLENGGTTPAYLGRRLRGFGDDNRIYNNGGASYVLNQASVGLLADHLDDDDCQPHTKKPWEDVLVKRRLVLGASTQ